MRVIGQNDITVDSSLADEILKRSGENVFLCYQCRKCASGCPSRMFMDNTPAELMRYVQLGMAEEAMKGSTVWYCTSCQTCSARCPQDIDIAHVVDTVRILVQEKRVNADTKNMRLFNWLWIKMLKYMGRVYELALTVMLNLFTGRPFKDLPLGIKMISKGKLRLLPSIRKPLVMRRTFSRVQMLKK